MRALDSSARYCAVALLPSLLVGCHAPAKAPPAVTATWAGDSVARFVDPFIGTGGAGNTFPGALVPWGMVAPSPHTRQALITDVGADGSNAAAGYLAGDPQIHGFGMTHLSGVGCPDLGAPVVAVETGAVATDFDSYGSAYTNERAWPGYYAVDLANGIRAELTAGTHAGILRFWDDQGTLTVLVDVARPLSWNGGVGHVELADDGEVSGWVQTGLFCAKPNHQKVYFAGRFNRAAQKSGTWVDDLPTAARTADGSAGAWFQFPAHASVELQMAVSYVDADGARANLHAELDGTSFDPLRLAAQAAWEAQLGRIRVDGAQNDSATDDDKTIFYSALYHALIHPSIASDVDGRYQMFGGGGIGTDTAHARYHVFSLWDSYRTVHPLLTLFYPERQTEMLRSLANMTIEAGVPPMWELAGSEVQMMVGDPADIVLADGIVKNVAPPDDGALMRQAWPLVQAAALDTTSKSPHRPGNAAYRSLGYVDIDEQASVWGPVSTTLEYAVADFALERWSVAGAETIDPTLATQFNAWSTLVDPTTQLFRPRHADGSWLDPFDPDAIDGAHPQVNSGGPGFVEGTAWQYAFYAPHAVAAQATATGGADAYVARLQSLFDTNRFVMWNEPDMGFPYLFTQLAGAAWHTADAVAAARKTYFTSARDGIPGNDDCGTLSAWYVFSALGFYPDVPAGNDYAIGTPLFDSATLTVGGNTFVIQANRQSPSSIYVGGAMLGGRALGQRLDYADLIAGGTLALTLTDGH
ncbi:MAG TPA: GH92 family glycosyl hydrolase [Polyangia bacterium]|nr:GH92 family glycosyl hydrolase [Polyangia bacterium]